jgi:exo-beta-1,3-glucanase (GH17 family)
MRFFSTIVVAFLLTSILAHSVFSQTKYSGTLTNSNSAWSGDVELTAAVTVPKGVTLSIAAGTKVKGNFTITVDSGIVDINGTVDNPVDFYLPSFNVKGGGLHSFEFVTMYSYGGNAIELFNAEANLLHVQIQQFSNNGVYIHGDKSKVKMEFCTIGSSLRLFDNTDVTEGISLNIAADAASSAITVKNSIFGFLDNAKNTGLVIGAPSNVKISYTFITGPKSKITTTDTLAVYRSEKPSVKDIPNRDYHLDWYSPCIDAGDMSSSFALEPEPNGNRVDIGYYGNTSQARESLVMVRKPNGRDSLTPGKTTKIEWFSSKYAGDKILQYSSDSGKTWKDITTITKDSGSFTWTVPNVKSPNCFVKLYHANSTDVTDSSDAVFTIGDTVGVVRNIIDTNRVIKDPKYFSVLCYGPYRIGQTPEEPNNLAKQPTYAQIREDLVFLKQFTHGIRLYGPSKDALKICDSLGLEVHMGVWINKGVKPWDTDSSDRAHLDEVIALANEKHPSLKTLIIGNEYLLRTRFANLDVGAAEKWLVDCIKDTRKRLKVDGIQLTTAESWTDWATASDTLYKTVDFVCWHIHPWWEQKPIDFAAEYVVTNPQTGRLRIMDCMKKAGVSNKKQILGETGWPWGMTPDNNAVAVASEENQARYLRELHKLAFENNLEYWFFEPFDEDWKKIAEGGVGDKWGMWPSNHDQTKPHPIVNQLQTLIPKYMMWENPDYVTAVVEKKTVSKIISSVQGSFNELCIYDLRGRRVFRIVKNQPENISLISATIARNFPLAAGVYTTRFLLNGKQIKSDRVLFR